MRRLALTLLIICMTLFPISGTAGNESMNPVYIIATTAGELSVELFINDAPVTVRNFIGLAEGNKEFTDHKTGDTATRPFYDNLTFHRVIKNFMIQGGCPKADGTGGPGYTFEDEINAVGLGLDKIKVIREGGGIHPHLLVRTNEDFHRNVLAPLLKELGINSQEELDKRKPDVQARLNRMTIKDCYENQGYRYNDKLKSHAPTRGVLAMANSGPNTNGSQFFINLADTPWLTGKHTVFGKVIKGMDVVDKIGETAVSANGRPEKDVTILSIRRAATP